MRTMAQFSRLSDDNAASGEDIYTIDIYTIDIYTIDIYTVAHTEMETAPITRSYFERTPALDTVAGDSGDVASPGGGQQTRPRLCCSRGPGPVSGCHGVTVSR